MSRIPDWFERRFDFSSPVELLPNLQARLRGAPARLEEAVRGCTSAQLITRPGGKWSAQEHAGHLLDLESLWLTRVGDYVNGNPELTPTDLQNRATDLAGHNRRSLVEILAGFRSARRDLLATVQRVDPFLYECSIPHPRLRVPMRLIDHLYFVAEHDDHHLAYIWELTGNGQ